jgi:hypothetical protein
MLICYQVYLALDEQVPMAETTSNDSVSEHDINLPWSIKMLIYLSSMSTATGTASNGRPLTHVSHLWS